MVSQRAQGTLAGICDCHDALLGFRLADSLFQLLFQDAESEGRLGRRP
ncbi:hypothetical protein Barb7_03092 [Bacteroidales bacterium Barb7]|nr:hypothetical protein Barb7_03092 [Bacteroidales bacterium Barb7]